MPEQNPINNPTEEPLSDRNKGGYGMFGRHDSSQIDLTGKVNSTPTIYPGSGMGSEKSGIKHLIKTTGGA